MAAILIYPGQQGEPVALLSVLREAHDAARAARQSEIDARKKARVPLDDSTNWQEVGEAIARASIAHGDRNTATVADAARTLLAHVDGNALEPIGEFVADPDLDGIVSFAGLEARTALVDGRPGTIDVPISRVRRACASVAAAKAVAKLTVVSR